MFKQIRIEEHKHSAIGKHLRDAHNQRNKDLQEQFTILKKCRGKFECIIYETLFIQEMKPKLNTQSDSIKAKLHVFSTSLSLSMFHIVAFLITCNEILTHILAYKELTRIWLLVFTNLKMMNDSSKRHSQFLSLIFILNCLSKASVIRICKLPAI